jgi:hypothetical protein
VFDFAFEATHSMAQLARERRTAIHVPKPYISSHIAYNEILVIG